MFSSAARSDTWTGAGEAPADQTRDWTLGDNWQSGSAPLANDQNTFTLIGEGTIELNGAQSAGAMIFDNFTYTKIAPGALPASLTMVNPAQGVSRITAGETVRDTYGVDYFTAGPEITAEVILGAPLNINLGANAASRFNSAMMISGQISNPQNNSLTYAGASSGAGGVGNGTSLWISYNNEFNGSPANPITITSAGGGRKTLHLVDAGRMNFSPIVLTTTSCSLGLQDNTGGGILPPVPNQYFNWVKSYGGSVFADRSYQLNDLDATVNVLQELMGGVTVYGGGTANFGTSSTWGRTNNGYGILLDTLNWDTAPAAVMINVYNGNLTEDRGGSRYVSGANRLQESHNYTYVENLSENQAKVVPFTKGGNGVLAVEQVNGGGQWLTSPRVSGGVLRLGTPANPHNAPSVILTSTNAGVGFGWDTRIDLNNNWGGGIRPFPVTPAAAVSGQSGAVDIDMWGHGVVGNIVDPNVLNGQTLTYLRVGSSKGADANFDTQPNPLKHASTTATIVPARAPQQQNFYLGGGGGTLRIDSVLLDRFPDNYSITCLEMGTTGNLLPGRVALNPGGEGDPEQGANTYTGMTDIWAGTLQLMKKGSVNGTSSVSLTTNCTTITNGLYDTPNRFNNTLWKGPGMLLLDPVTDPQSINYKDWNLNWYTAQGGGPLLNALSLDGGVIGWTNDVVLPSVPGTYGSTITCGTQSVYVLGLGGEYSAGTMYTAFQINNSQYPVLLYKAGNNSKLDLRWTPGGVNNYWGTIIAGGEVIVNDPDQICGDGTKGDMYGGPIVILNGGKLHVTQGSEKIWYKSFAVNTDGTPNLQKNCGSVLEIDEGVTVNSWALFDFSWAPAQYLEKTGGGTFFYNAQGPWTPTPGPRNAWGLKLTDGLVIVNQLPVDPGSDTGPAIFNGGDLEVVPLPFPDYNETLPYDPAYGFRNIVSFKGTESTVNVHYNCMFRTHGIVPNEILGTVNFIANDLFLDPSVIHLSRNMSPAGDSGPGSNSRGNGTLTFENVTVYMSGGGSGNNLSVLPQDAGFTLKLRNGVVFNASRQNTINGAVYFENTNAFPVKIDGEEAIPPTPTDLFFSFALVPQTWTIAGTGLTFWIGTTEKVGPGTVLISRSQGAPVTVSANALLRITGGTFEAGGTADPFTSTVTGLSMDVVNNSTATGLLISNGIKGVDDLTGVGNTTVNGPAGTELIATSIVQNTLTIGPGCIVTIRPIPGGPLAGGANLTSVPEPSTWIILALAGVGLFTCRACRRLYSRGC